MSNMCVGGRRLSPEEVIASCLASANACDKRKGHDLSQLLQLQAGLWRERFAVEGLFGLPDLSLAVLCRLQVMGLIWATGRPQPHDRWRLLLMVPHNYPLSVPALRFIDATPYCPHVVHASFLSNTAGMPSELQQFLRLGHGYCCYIRAAQWSSDISCSLALVIWQVSRILVMDKVFGEAVSLNAFARDYALRLRAEGKTPLGSPLPYPAHRVCPERYAPLTHGETERLDSDNDDIDWIEDENNRE